MIVYRLNERANLLPEDGGILYMEGDIISEETLSLLMKAYYELSVTIIRVL